MHALMKEAVGSWKHHRKHVLEDPGVLADMDQAVEAVQQQLKQTGVDLKDVNQSTALLNGAMYVVTSYFEWVESHNGSIEPVEELMNCQRQWMVGAAEVIQETVFRAVDWEGLKPICRCGHSDS